VHQKNRAGRELHATSARRDEFAMGDGGQAGAGHGEQLRTAPQRTNQLTPTAPSSGRDVGAEQEGAAVSEQRESRARPEQRRRARAHKKQSAQRRDRVGTGASPASRDGALGEHRERRCHGHGRDARSAKPAERACA
jgi:hypothetical protein